MILTSNLTLGQLAAVAEREIDDALHGRLITIPPPSGGHGMFETLHGAKDGIAFATQIKTLATTHWLAGS